MSKNILYLPITKAIFHGAARFDMSSPQNLWHYGHYPPRRGKARNERPQTSKAVNGYLAQVFQSPTGLANAVILFSNYFTAACNLTVENKITLKEAVVCEFPCRKHCWGLQEYWSSIWCWNILMLMCKFIVENTA